MADSTLDYSNPSTPALTPTPSFMVPRSTAFTIGLIGSGLCVVGWLLTGQPSRDAFYRAWLFAWFFFFGLTTGCMGWVMIHHMLGGGWGRAIQRFAEAAMLNVPLMAVLFIPIMIGVKSQYPWADPAIRTHDAILMHKSIYLNIPFWIVRSLIYFAVWSIIPITLVSLQRKYDEAPSPRISLSLKRWSSVGLILLVFGMTLAGVDWIMSREAHWFSNIFGFILVVGQALTSINFLVICLTLMLQTEPLKRFVTRGHYNDLGNLMFTTVILWTYMNLAQFLITWMGSMQDDVKYYHSRWNKAYAIMAIVLHFAIPFFILLSRDLKRRPDRLVKVAIGIFCIHVVDVWFMVWPSNRPPVESFNRYWLNVAALVGVGGLWLGMFLYQLAKRPLLASLAHGEPSHAASHMADPSVGPHGESHVHPA